ncbi:MAG: beta-ketoacyl-ACP synthase II [Myxococcota bacterium]|nr:beta-ketoacyl-ACP synthase II [Myxococcota bacterium]
MKKVVVTGLGMVSPLGIGVAKNWQELTAGRSGIRPISLFEPDDGLVTKIAGEVPDFDPTAWLSKPEARRYDRFLHLTLAAGLEALEDSGLVIDEGNASRVATILGVGLGGMPFLEETIGKRIETRKLRRVSPFFIPAIIANMAPGLLSIYTGARGESWTATSACASANHAIGSALRALRSGACDAVLTGGSEAVVCHTAIAGFNAMKALSTRNDDPATASRPFDADRDGFVLGEGAGVLVLETEEHALARGARIYAEVAGFGATADAHHITSPRPDGDGAVQAMAQALRDGGIANEQVGYINAHGTSTAANDRMESAAIRKLFGGHSNDLAVSSTKSMTGHLLGAAAAIEAIYSVLALHHGVLPPTINQFTSDPECDLDYIPHHARQSQVEVALSNSLGFGGTNAAVAFRRNS